MTDQSKQQPESESLPETEEGALARSLPSWDVFPEVPAALEEARRRGWRLAILSNSDADLIAASKARIGVPFDETVVDRRGQIALHLEIHKPAEHGADRDHQRCRDEGEADPERQRHPLGSRASRRKR